MNPILDIYPYKDFLAEYADSKDSRDSYASDLKQLDIFLKSRGHTWETATPEDLTILFGKFRDNGHQNNTMGRKRACYRAFYGFLVGIEKIVKNPTDILKRSKLKPVKPNPKALDKDNRKKLLNCLRWDKPGSHHYRMSLAIILGLQHGLRRHEIAKIKWEDFDFDTKRLKVLGKGLKLATIPMSPLLIEKLEPIKATEGYLFYEPGGSHRDKGTIQLWVKEVGREWAGFPKSVPWSTHVLRHVFCSTIAEAGTRVEIAIKLTRHSSVQTYIANYVKVDENEVSDQHAKIFS